MIAGMSFRRDDLPERNRSCADLQGLSLDLRGDDDAKKRSRVIFAAFLWMVDMIILRGYRWLFDLTSRVLS